MMHLLITLLAIILAMICGVTNTDLSAEELRPGHYNVGYRIVDFKYKEAGQDKTLTVAVWYPTASQPQKFNYGGPTTGIVAQDAVPLSNHGPFPLLVFSHGYGGSGISSVFLTERLASYGWIVAAPDHHDKFSAVRIRTGQSKDFDQNGFLKDANEIASSTPADRSKYLYRLDEMQITINHMIESDYFRNVIDVKRIAVGGHSFGGFTALGLCGTIKERLDPRIKAVLLFSTGAGGYLFREDELAAVKIPSMLFIGEREKKQKRGQEKMSDISNKIYRVLPSPKYFLEVKGANHFSFNNTFKERLISRFLSGTSEQFEIIGRYSIAFLEKHVAMRHAADRVLEHTDPMLTLYKIGLQYSDLKGTR